MVDVGGAAYVWDASGWIVDVDGVSDEDSSGESCRARDFMLQDDSRTCIGIFGARVSPTVKELLARRVLYTNRGYIYLLKSLIPIPSVLLRFG